MIQLADKWAFLFYIPLVFALWYILTKNKNLRAALKFSSLKQLNQISPGVRAQLKYFPTVLRATAIGFMIYALARPQHSDSKIKKNVEGIDIILLVDLSPTMLIEDMPPNNRLEAAKVAQIEFVNNRPNDRIGIVAFSGEAYTAVPPTLDHKIVIEKLNQLDYSEKLKQGTAQGVAIATGVARLKDSTAKSKIMVFVTDGENNTGTIDPDTALKIAKDYNIKIYTIGVGTDGPKQLPIFVTDASGRRVKTYRPMTSTFYEQAMIKIAQDTGGKYWRSKSTKELLDVYKEIDRLEKSEVESTSYTKYTELYEKYLKTALILFSLSVLLSMTAFRSEPA
jgi:Ca-activated chloride channel family protein